MLNYLSIMRVRKMENQSWGILQLGNRVYSVTLAGRLPIGYEGRTFRRERSTEGSDWSSPDSAKWIKITAHE